MRLRLLLLLLCLSAPWAVGQIDPDLYLDDVKYLASDELKGRGTGTPGLEMAGEYIAGKFREAGLQPVASGDWFQPFSVTTDAKLGDGNELVWEWEDEAEGESEEESLEFEEEFIPLNFSSAGSYSGQVVFAGYGITAPEYNYDDYAGLDVQGKFVLLLRHEPQENDDDSVFAGDVYTEHSQLASKATNAKLHGALGVLMVNDPYHHDASDGELTDFEGSAGPGDAGIPFVHVEADVVREWMWLADEDLDSIERGIDEDLVPESFAFPQALDVELVTDLTRDPATVRNVVGYIPGRTSEYVVLGAHYDHLGLGEQFSMSPSRAGTVHPGADDNASGTAGLIELARKYGAEPQAERGVLFIAFASEELGLLGSSYYVRNPLLPIEDAVAMLNMDMIGRVRGGKAYIGGVDSGSTFQAMLDDLLPANGLNVEMAGSGGYGSSDHTSFTTRRVPILFFFSGLHYDYHRPSDTWEKINAKGAVHILDLVAEIVDEFREGAPRPDFISVPIHSMGEGGGGSGYGPLFGSVPDFSDNPDGLRLADIRPGTPAAKAGLVAGDVLVEFDGAMIENLYDFTYVLRSKEAGDTVSIKVLRDGEIVSTTATLEERN